ncbi:MAG: S1C family serine protease [Planctomycetota bacterium]
MMFRWPYMCSVCFVALFVASLSTPTRGLAAEVPDERVLEAEQRRIAAIDEARKTTISVFAPGGKGGGSAVVISPDGYALSNFHVVKPIGHYMQCGMADNQLYDAVLVGVDPTGDVALIKLLGRDDFPHAELGDSEAVQVGDWCFVIGNPFMLATDLQPTVSYGMVSGVNRYQPPAGTLLEYTDCIQTDAAINPGNSGGPLFNAQGELIGINGRGSFEKRGRVNVGVGYAISVNQIKKFMGYLRSGRIVDHATLGATVTSDEEGRVVVSEILQSSDAYRRGLRYGDRVLSFGGREINSVNGFKNVLGIFPRGWRVPLSFRHEKERHDVWVRLAGVHSRQELMEKIEGPGQRLPSQPKPKKRPGDPAPKPPEGPRKVPRPSPPKPHPSANPAAKKPLPDHVARLFKRKSGYANYYFNELHQDRVWSQFTEFSNCVDLPASWTLRGRMNDQAPFEITLDQKQVAGVFPSSRAIVDLRVDLDQQLLPLGSGGLLPTLSLWQRLLTNGPEDYGEVYYLGTAPLIDRDGLFDVLVGIHNVVESRFAFDPDHGNLVALEMFPETNADPCELYFSDYREVNGRLLPYRIVVRHGDAIFTELEIEEYEMGEDSSDPS